jgi:hypothetical protein
MCRAENVFLEDVARRPEETSAGTEGADMERAMDMISTEAGAVEKLRSTRVIFFSLHA